MRLFNFSFRRATLAGTKKKIFNNLYWATLSKIANLLSGLIIGIAVARYLGPEQFGLMNYVISYVFLFQTFAIFGLDSIEIREEARSKYQRDVIIGSAFTLKMAFAIIFITATIGTSLILETDKQTTALIAIYSTSIVFNTFTVIRNYFYSILKNEYVVKSEIVRIVIGLVLKLSLLLANASLVWFIAASAFDYLLLSSGYYYSYKSLGLEVKDWKFDKGCALYLLKEAFPLLLTSTAVIVYQRIDQVMIGKLIDKESVGYFSVASRFVEILIYIPMMFSQVMMPVLVSIREKSNDEYAKKGQMFMNLSIWLSCGAAIAISLLSYYVITFTFGKTYTPAVVILQIMSFKAMSVALSNTAGAMLVVEGLQKYAIFRDAFGCIVCISLNLYLLPRYGIIAAAYIAILSNVAAGYLADAFIPQYRHLFVRQTKALMFGWKDVLSVNKIITLKH